MLYGFVKCAAITNDISVADFEFNSESIIEKAEEAAKNNTEIAVFPELCITGYTCGDLFLQRRLINGAKKELIKIAERTKELNMLFAVGLPFEYEGQLYNCAAVIFKGRILGIVPKSYIPNYNEFYEKRHFTQQIFFVHYGIFRWYVCNGSRIRRKPSDGSLFQFLPDCLDSHYRSDYDCHGAGKCMGRPDCR